MLLEGGSGGDSRLGSRHGRSTLRNTLAAVNVGGHRRRGAAATGGEVMPCSAE
jgi:hypothetical protein